MSAASVWSDSRGDASLADTTASDLASAEHAMSDTRAFLATKARPWFEAEGLRPGEEPVVRYQAGLIAVEIAAARAALAAATEEDSEAEAQSRMHDARALAGAVAARAAIFLFEAGGTSTTDDPGDFGRHWRVIRARGFRAPAATSFIQAGRAALGRSSYPERGADPETNLKDSFGSLNDVLRRAAAVAATVRRTAARRDRERIAPTEELALLARSGLLGIGVPSRHGGLGLPYADAMEVARIVSTGDSSIGQILTIHYGMVNLLLRVGTAEQQTRWWPAILAGARAGNAAAERGVAHAKITETRLFPDEDGVLRLEGRKFYSTGAPSADLVVVLAVDAEGTPVSVLLPADTPGLTVVDDWRGLGQRGTGSGTTILDRIAVDELSVLPRWLNADRPNTGTAAANLAHVGIDLGIAEDAFEDGLALLRVATDGHVVDTLRLHHLGEMSAALYASRRLFAEALARLKKLDEQSPTVDTVQAFSLQVGIAKAHAGDLAVRVGSMVCELAETLGVPADLSLDRHWRNARTHTLHDPNRWRYLRSGDFALHGRLPPRNRCN